MTKAGSILLPILILIQKIKSEQKKRLFVVTFFSRGELFSEGVVTLHPNSSRSSAEPIKSYKLKENHIGSAITKILWYSQIPKQIDMF